MAKLDEMSLAAKVGVLLVIGAVVAVGFYFWPLGAIYDDMKQLRAEVADKHAENERLKQYVPKLAQLDKQVAELEQQLQEAKKIVPDEREADKFITELHDTAAASGIEIRRYTSMPLANHDFYTEVPFQIDIDGSYFSVLNFFDKIAKLERIITIGNLQMSNTKTTGPAKVKSTYSWAPGETVVASCTATTFFSHDLMPPTEKPGAPKQ